MESGKLYLSLCWPFSLDWVWLIQKDGDITEGKTICDFSMQRDRIKGITYVLLSQKLFGNSNLILCIRKIYAVCQKVKYHLKESLFRLPKYNVLSMKYAGDDTFNFWLWQYQILVSGVSIDQIIGFCDVLKYMILPFPKNIIHC